MRKKQIGFIDLHIDEWHANNYPAWFRSAKRADDFELGYAWEESPNPDGLPLPAWCEKFSMKPATSIAEVIEKSDCLCVLAPSNPEAHARLAALPLRSGKPLYIDKTFAPDKETAETFFRTARDHGTPLMSSSALRYGAELQAVLSDGTRPRPRFISTFGGGSSFQEYSIHQIEMVVAALGTGAKSVIREQTGTTPHLAIEYDDAVRGATLTYDPRAGFMAILEGDHAPDLVTAATRSFENLIDAMLDFYSTGRSPIPEKETIEIAAIRAAAIEAEQAPGRRFSI